MNKRLLALLTVLALLMACVPAGVTAEGIQEQLQTAPELLAESQETETQVSVTPEAHSHGGAAAHDCEHCDAENIEWIAWGDDEAEKTTAPTGTGHYYLVADIQVADTTDVNHSADLVLCLNGYSIDGQLKKYIYRVGTNNSTTDKTKVTVVDCTAYTDAEGVYHAGALMNGKGKDGGGAFFLRGASSLYMYDGILSGHQNTQTAAGWGGGAITSRNTATICLENVLIENCSTPQEGGAIGARDKVQITLKNVTFRGNSAEKAGGAVALCGGANTLKAEGCIFLGNSAGTEGGAIATYATGKDAVTLTDCVFGGTGENEGNTAAANGGAVYIPTGCSVTVTGGAFIGNTSGKYGGAIYTKEANTTVTGYPDNYVRFHQNWDKSGSSGGAVFATGSSDVKLQYVEMTENMAEGSGGSAIMITGDVRVTMADVTVTGNRHASNGTYRGAVYVTGRVSTLTLTGKVIIRDNQNADLYVQNNNYNRDNDNCWVTVDGLTEGSDILLHTHTSVAQNEARLNNRILEGQPENWTKNWMIYAANDMAVDYDRENDKFFFAEKAPDTDHFHCHCGDGTDSRCDHTENAYLPWNESNSLPDSGCFYLETDVVLPENVRPTGELILCLNGHTVDVAFAEQGNTRDRHFTLNSDDHLVISDCTAKEENGIYTAGKLIGSSYAPIMVANSSTSDNTVVIDFYDGIVTGNSSSAGGAFCVQDGATLNIYGGELSNNHSTNLGGAIYIGTHGTLNLYGGKITGNTADGRGAIFVEDSAVSIYDCTVTGNTAAGAGIYVNRSAVTMGGAPVITGNTADGVAANLYLVGTSLITFDNMTGGSVGVGASTAPVYLSGDMGQQDLLAFFTPDSQYRTLENKENKLYLNFTGDHSHCACAGEEEGCDHTDNPWMPWESTTSLPSGDGWYYLLSDVTVTEHVNISAGHIHLCLNGHTVTAAGEEETKGDRFFTLQKEACLTISDCTAKEENGVYTAGKLIGATNAAIMIVNQTAEGKVNNVTVNLYDGIIAGNSVTNTHGVIAVQDQAVFNMYGGQVSDNGAKIYTDADGKQNGGYGGAFYVGTEAVLNLYGGRVCNNTAEGQGAFYVTGGSKMNMFGGEISGNSAAGNAGGVLLSGKDVVMTITGGTITGNKTEKSGGGIVVQDKATLILKDGVISKNTAATSGGGILTHGEGTVFTMEGGQITENDSPNGGGIINQWKSVFNLKGGKISNNTAKNGAGLYGSYTTVLNMTGGEISGNSVTSNGGGIYSLGSELNLSGGKISGNYAKGSGGGVYTSKYTRFTGKPNEITYTSTVNLKGTTVSGNTANGTGAGVTVYMGRLNMSAGTVTGNKAKGAAGGILVMGKGGHMNLSGGTITGNHGKSGGGVYISTNCSIHMTGGSVTYNTSTANTGGMYLLQAEGVFSGGQISYNSTEGICGGVYFSGSKVKLCGTDILNNTSVTNAGGVCTTRRITGGKEYLTSITMTGGTIAGNTTGGSGGGILLQAKTTMDLQGGIIEKNHSTKDGGGMYVSSNCNFTMNGGEIRENASDRNGGGLYNLKANVNYVSGKIVNNTALSGGGAIVMTGEGYVVNMKEGMVITENTAMNGGAIVVQGRVTLNMENVDLTNNRATTGSGGAIYLSTNSFLNIKGGSITNHSCDGYGGAIFSTTNSTLTMDGMTIQNNKAGYGGALSLGGTVNISNVTIAQNEATEEGGGIYCHKLLVGGLYENHLITIKDTVIENNKAGKQGGGVYVRRGSKCLFDGLTVQGNTSGLEGGGLYVVDDTSMYNMNVTGNTSGGEGYALYLADAEYDGESYFIGIFKLGGEMKVTGNQGGDMYFGAQTAAAVDHMGLTGDTRMDITLYEGYLTQVLQGVYDYEGGDLNYVVTAGDRSITDPEYDALWNDQFKTEEPTEEPTGDDTGDGEQTAVNPVIWIVCGAGAVMIAAIVAIVAVLGKKKKAAAEK